MTNDEMEIKWPHLPPFDCRFIKLMSDDKNSFFDVSEDTIDEILEYFQAVKECME